MWFLVQGFIPNDVRHAVCHLYHFHRVNIFCPYFSLMASFFFLMIMRRPEPVVLFLIIVILPQLFKNSRLHLTKFTGRTHRMGGWLHLLFYCVFVYWFYQIVVQLLDIVLHLAVKALLCGFRRKLQAEGNEDAIHSIYLKILMWLHEKVSWKRSQCLKVI